jgi:hypothetical protein
MYLERITSGLQLLISFFLKWKIFIDLIVLFIGFIHRFGVISSVRKRLSVLVLFGRLHRFPFHLQIAPLCLV